MERNGNEMISFGAGVNSVAMTIMLVNEGWRGPIVFADTGGEHPETYCYMEYFEREFLIRHGLEITRLEPGSVYHGREAQESLESYCLRIGIIPLLAVRWCSIRWKRKPLNAFREAHGIKRDLLGISASEPRRVRYDDPTKCYPLVEADIHRSGCIHIIQQADLELPVKSSCFFCPGQRVGQWRALYHDHPDLFARAVAMEDNATVHRRNKSIAALDPDGVPLRERAKRRWKGQMQMDLSRWLPCICHL